MKYLKLFESFNKFSFDNLDEMEIENQLLEFSDKDDLRFYNYEKSDSYRFPSNMMYVGDRIYDLYGDKFTQKTVSSSTFLNKPCITFMIDIPHPGGIRGNLYLEGFTRDVINRYLEKIHKFYDVKIYYQILETNYLEDWISKTRIFIIPNISVNESVQNDSNLLVVDVQKSFKKWFTEKYVSELKKYASQFTNVYQIWDNHVDGKNVDKDYLYDHNPKVPVHNDLYTFPNQKELIEKRYNYDVDVEFYKKVLDKEVYEKIKSTKLKKGDYFHTTEETIIVYIGNNHQWFHVPVKLYKILKSLVDKEITIVGGSDSECLEDIVTTCESLGVKVKRDWKYIYSASHCPIS